jgi:hypothetical protein
VLGVQLLQFLLLEVRVQLDLVDGGNHRRLGQQTVQDLRHEVADADGPHLAVGEEYLQRAVRVERQVEAAGQRLVKQ